MNRDGIPDVLQQQWTGVSVPVQWGSVVDYMATTMTVTDVGMNRDASRHHLRDEWFRLQSFVILYIYIYIYIHVYTRFIYIHFFHFRKWIIQKNWDRTSFSSNLIFIEKKTSFWKKIIELYVIFNMSHQNWNIETTEKQEMKVTHIFRELSCQWLRILMMCKETLSEKVILFSSWINIG